MIYFSLNKNSPFLGTEIERKGVYRKKTFRKRSQLQSNVNVGSYGGNCN